MDATTADRMAAGLGTEVALEIVEQINDYADRHVECELIGVTVTNHGGGNVEVKVRHAPGCPSIRGRN